MRDSKMIRITSRGMVTTSRGRVITPILCPYRESISRIWSMLTVDRADIEEKLPDGTFVKLTAQNFDKENFVSKEVKHTTVKPKVNDKSDAITFKNTDANKKEEVTDKTPVVIPEEVKSVEIEEVETPEEKVDDVVEEVKTESTEHTVTVNGEKRVDPRFNKKNKNKNRNNQNNNQSLAVDAEVVE